MMMTMVIVDIASLLNGSECECECVQAKCPLNELMCNAMEAEASSKRATEAEVNFTESIAIRNALSVRCRCAIHHKCQTIHINKRQ